MPLLPPRPASRRGRLLGEQRAVERRGAFRDRLIEFPFTVTDGGTSQTQKLVITSMGTNTLGAPSYVRLLGVRGVLVQAVDVTPDIIPILLAQLRLRVQLNALSDLIAGNAPANDASFASLFSTPMAPWLWFDDPPRCRAGDTLQATINNTLTGDGSAMLATVSIRVMADELWTKLYLQEAL